MKRTLPLLLTLMLALAAFVFQPGTAGAAESDDLYAAINTYRQGLGLTAIPLSPQLTSVARAHVQDLMANFATDPNYTGAGCVPHGWSSQGQWTGGCYKFEDPSTFQIMWSKPQEIANYPGSGFEILFGGGGGPVTAAEALQAWQSDAPHNDVIVNQGIWQDHPWQAIGVWVEDGWASVWFGEQADPNATQPAAAQAGQPADTAATGGAPAAPAAPADGGAGTTNTDTTNTGTTNTDTTNTGTTNTGTTNAGTGDTTNGGTTAGANANAAGATAAACGDAEEVAFLKLINDYRAANGAGPLAMSPTLSAAAKGHSQDMATKNYFDHVGLDGSTYGQRLAAAGYTGANATAENIFAGDETAAGAFGWWKNSPGHNANMLNPNFTAIGIGRAFDANSQFGWYWTTTFGDKVDATCGEAATAAQPAGNTGQATGDGATNNGQPAQAGTTNGQTGTTNGQANQPQNGADQDGDGLTDDDEVNFFGTDPTRADTDGGGTADGIEVANNTNPLDPADDNAGGTQNGNTGGTDSDGDGLLDSDETDFFQTNPQSSDTDGDGVSDGDEVFNGTDPLDPTSF